MEWVSGNIFIRPFFLEKEGDYIDGHTHHFGHTMVLHYGNILVEATGPNGEQKSIRKLGPSHLYIAPDWTHKITAESENVNCWCMYSHRTPQGDVVQENTGWEKAYQ